ncbi:hypothetical protein NUU18_04100 [Pediococcus pentosaceus]|uniref:hypothetical protein n=1 Tax=Pediococcus pentosaceus TaxID=1255 RepID=UPI0021E73234|nr:hypothetical protein [Pediococcus pentosaceus]MCV3325561.1 hypothetical protein [Pediococcus pentosaceus]
MPIQVMLPPEYDKSLRTQIEDILDKAVKEVRQKTGIDSPWLSSKQSASKWLDISVETLNTLVLQGMPEHEKGGKYFYNKAEMTEFLKE